MAELYAPPVAPVDLLGIARAVWNEIPRQRIAEDINYPIAFLSQTRLHGQNPSPSATRARVTSSTLSDDDVAQLLQNGLIVRYEGHPDDPPTVSAFLREELKGLVVRKRTIFHTVQANNTAPMPAPHLMRITSYPLLFRRTGNDTIAATRDFKSFYHQLEFTPEVRRLLRFRHGSGELFSLTRAAMGHKGSAAAAHTLSNAITMLALHRAGVSASVVHYDIIIDDVLFSTSEPPALIAVLEAFDAICTEFYATIGKTQPPSPLVTHRGVTFDLASQTRNVKDTTIERLADRWSVYQRKPTVARAQSLAGSAVFVHTVTGADIGTVLFAAIRGAITNKAPSPDLIAAQMSDLLRNSPVPNIVVDLLPFAGVLVADATPDAWGAIFIDEHGESRHVAGHHDAAIPIHVSEALATIEGLGSLVPSFDTLHRLDVYTDNTNWLYTIHRSYAKCDALFGPRALFFDLCRRRNVVPQPSYIPTSQNPADSLSRDLDLDPELVQRATQAAIAVEEFTNRCKGGSWARDSSQQRGGTP